jgi:Tfp pilus assembly PilM family ATPase
MAKRGNSVIGLDLGKHAFKGVVLHRKGQSRYVLTSYASREVPENLDSSDDLAQQVKLLLKDLGGNAKGCAIAVSDPSSLLRIIEQPDTPVDLLRQALRLNGLAVELDRQG